LARVVFSPQWLYHTNPNHYVFEPHPQRSYAPIPGIEARWTNDDYDIAVHINQRGLRGPDFEAALESDLRIVAGGDSLTFGLGVEAEETWSNQLARLLGNRFPASQVSVLNSGVPGYGAPQIRHIMSELIEEAEPALAIFAMSTSTYYRTESPYVYFNGAVIAGRKVGDVSVTSDGTFIQSPFRKPWLRAIDIWSKQHCHLLAHVLSVPNAGRHHSWYRDRGSDDQEIRAAYRTTLDEISATRDFAAERGVAFAVLIIYRQSEDGSFHGRAPVFREVLAEFCERESIACAEFLDRMIQVAGGKPIFRFPTDNHWNARAHRMGAEELDQLIRDRSLLDEFRSS
jgi:hypothetical protein